MKYGPWLVHYNIQTFTSHNSTRWGCETDPNSVAESESDSSDEWELIHFLTVFLIKIQFQYQGNTQSQN